MFKKGDSVKVTPVSHPTVVWPGVVLGTRKHKYLGVTYKVRYEVSGVEFNAFFQTKELTF